MQNNDLVSPLVISAVDMDTTMSMNDKCLENPIKFEKSFGIKMTLDREIVPKSDQKEEKETY